MSEILISMGFAATIGAFYTFVHLWYQSEKVKLPDDCRSGNQVCGHCGCCGSPPSHDQGSGESPEAGKRKQNGKRSLYIF